MATKNARKKAGGGKARRAKPSAAKPARKKAKAKARAKPARARARSARTAPRRPSRPNIPAGPTELDTIKLAYLFRDTSPASIYRALLDSAEHSLFTGDRARIDAQVGGEFSAFRGFIHGRLLELVPDARIVKSWRTNHFPRNNPDSTVELTLTPVPEGTRLELRHFDIPKGQREYLVEGWVKFYWNPLAKHLGKRASMRPPSP